MVNQQLIDYIKKEELQGYTPQRLRDYLIQLGYNAQDVDEAIAYTNQNTSPTGSSDSGSSKKRPGAITLFSILFFIEGAMTLIPGLILIIKGGFKSISFLQIIPVVGSLLSKFIIIFMLLILGIGILNILIGWGLWKLQNWARVAALVISIISLVILILISLVFIMTIFVPVLLLIPIIIQIVIIHILKKDSVKKAFGV